MTSVQRRGAGWIAAAGTASAAALLISGCAGKSDKASPGSKEPLPASTAAPAVSSAPTPIPAHAPEPGDAAPPEWWHEGTQTQDGAVSVCSKAESKELREARQLALDSAMRVFREVYGTRTETPSVLASSMKLADGTYRAFVKVSASR
jgi:hypothetical protein